MPRLPSRAARRRKYRISRANRDFYLGLGLPRKRLFASPYFVDNQRFASSAAALDRQAVRQEFGITRDGFCFLFAGKLIKKKRIMDLLAALELVRSAGPRKVQVLVAGSGVQLDEARAFVRERGLAARFAGFLNQSEIPRAYRAADCLVLPSDHGETWGLVVNEAMACGLPAIVSDQVGCGPDLVKNGKTGYVFPFGDRQALARRMEEMAWAPEEAARMGEAARDLVFSSYSIETALEGVLAALESVLA